MKEHPILFSAPMVRAIIEGRKTQTRRIMKPQPQMVAEKQIKPWDGDPAYLLKLMLDIGRNCPYGQLGDQLWVREAWQYYDWSDDGDPCIRFSSDNATTWPFVSDDWQDRVVDVWEILSRDGNFSIDNRARDRRWRPSIHMPRWASRITLEIVSVRVERLQDISEADAKDEGIDSRTGDKTVYHFDFSEQDERFNISGYKSAKSAYIELWRSINGPDSWDANPWVWVVEFKRIKA